MSGSNVIWRAGDSRSIKLTKRISDEAYEALNTKDMRVRSNRNKFIAKAINSQTIIEFGTLEEKLRLIGIDDLSVINQEKTESMTISKDDFIEEYHLIDSTKPSNKLTNLLDSIPTK